jgi:hypothetical protein
MKSVPTTYLTNNGEGPIDLPRLHIGLDVLADAFKRGTTDDYGMRIPPEPYRDGDLVCCLAMSAIKQFQEITDALTARCEANRDFLIHLRDEVESAAGGDAPRNSLEELLYDIDEYLRSLADAGSES